MPRRACNNPMGVYADSDTGIGLGPKEVMKSTTSMYAKSQRDNYNEAQAKARRNTEENELIRLMQNQYWGQSAGGKDLQELRRLSNESRKKILDTAKDNVRNGIRDAQAAIELVQNRTVAAGSKFEAFKNFLYGTFVNSRAEMVKWLSKVMHGAGEDQAFTAPLVRAFLRISPTARGFSSRFLQRREALLDKYTEMFNRAGIERDRAAYLLGHYACALHAPERNALLIARWRALAREMFDKKIDRDDSHTTPAQYMKMADLLEQNLNVINPQFKDAAEASLFRSSGYTNAEAQAEMKRILDVTGFTREEAEAFCRDLTAEFNNINYERARMGTFDPETNIPDFVHYVPMISRKGTQFGNYVGVGNDATPYNPGSYYAAMGRDDPPDSAWITLQCYGNRAAAEIATRDFGYILSAIKEKYGKDYHGLSSMEYGKLMRTIAGGGAPAEAFRRMYNGGGFVAAVRKADGTLERRFYYFAGGDFEVNGTRFNSEMLNKALSADFKLSEPGPITSGLARATGFMGQLTTRFTPLFSPLSGMRDLMERPLNMVNRTYYAENGDVIKGSSVVGDFIANIGQAGNLLYRGMRGQLDMASREGRMYQEFLDYGLAQKFSQRTQVRDQTLNNALESIDRSYKIGNLEFKHRNMVKVLNNFGSAKNQLVGILDNWNDYFQNLAAFNQFLTLRKKGLSARNAADATMEMMDMSQRGSVTPYLQALAPFIVPTVQSGTAMLRSLGLGSNNWRDIWKNGKKGYFTLIGAALGYSMLMPLARSSMGQDENGVDNFDALSLDDASRSLPIGIGGNQYLRFPIGFGFAQLGALLAVGWERVNQGRMDMHDLAFEVMYAGMKNIAPGNWPQYDFSDAPASFIMSVLTPQPFRPIMEVASNTNYFGSRIYQPTQTPYESPAEKGRNTTPRVYHEQARWMRDTFGVDLQPEVYEAFERGYALGPFRALISFANSVDDIYKNSNRPPALDSVHPVFAAMGITSWYGKEPSASRSLYYEAQQYYADRISQTGLHMAAPRGADGEQWRRETLAGAGFDQNFIDDYIVLWRAYSELQAQGRDFNAEYIGRWDKMESSRELKEAFDRLGDANTAVYANAVEQLHYYR